MFGTKPEQILGIGFSNSLKYNLYIYCCDNPLKFTDPDGHDESLAQVLENAKKGKDFEKVVLELAKLAKNYTEKFNGRIPDGLKGTAEEIESMVEAKIC